MIICVQEGGNLQEAERLAEKLQIPCYYNEFPISEGLHIVSESVRSRLRSEIFPAADKAFSETDLALLFRPGGVFLTGDGMEMQGDLTHMLPRLKKGNLRREFLVKASRLKNPGDYPVAVDATAGMGEDSLLLAAAGYTVYLYENNPVIATLLKDSLRRASHVPELQEPVSRMYVREEDSVLAMREMKEPLDLILLDPMFPERRKSGLIKKKFQLLQRLERPCAEEDEKNLFEAAWAANPRRLIVKRPLKGPYLAGKKPDFSIDGKAIRYDCFTFISPGSA